MLKICGNLALVCFTVLLTACAAKPYAIIDGTRSQASDTDNYDVNIVSIDGKMEVGVQSKKVTPGFHYINVMTTKNLRSQTSKPQMFPVDAKECTRYLVTAQHRNGLADEWEVKLLREEPILSCIPSETKPQTAVLPDYLEPTQTVTCFGESDLSSKLTPAELYPSLQQCIVSGEDDKAMFNYVLASAYSFFDSKRVVDQTAHDAVNVIQKHSIWKLTALEQEKFQAKLTQFIETPESFDTACQFLVSTGRPDYIPTYMVKHGVKKLSTEHPDGVAEELVGQGVWHNILTDQIGCKL